MNRNEIDFLMTQAERIAGALERIDDKLGELGSEAAAIRETQQAALASLEQEDS